jgi:hypothetical protein
MPKTIDRIHGRKTAEQNRRTLQRQPDMPRKDSDGRIVGDENSGPRLDRAPRSSEFPVSQRGANQESRHNKHGSGEKH